MGGQNTGTLSQRVRNQPRTEGPMKVPERRHDHRKTQ